MSTKQEYIPGVCNIGDTEAANRKRTGIGGVVVTVVLWAAFIAIDLPAVIYIVLAFPAFVAATALMQSKQHFCAGFGAAGLYNFSEELGKTIEAKKAEDKAKDKKKAIDITIKAAVIGIVVAVIAGALSNLI